MGHFPKNEPEQGGCTLLRKHGSEDEIIKLKYPAPGYATIVRASAVYHMAERANYKRTIFAVSLAQKDVSKIDKSNVLLGAEYSDRRDLFTQYLNFRHDRLEKQI